MYHSICNIILSICNFIIEIYLIKNKYLYKFSSSKYAIYSFVTKSLHNLISN